MKTKIFRNLLEEHKTNRRNFIKQGFFVAGVFLFGRLFIKKAEAKVEVKDSWDISRGRRKKKTIGNYDIVSAKGEGPYAITVKAIELIGGMDRFVKKDSTVLIKPNISWDKNIEQAANTNPYVVAALIDLCFKAKAKRVNVFDNSCNDKKRCYINSGMQSVVREHGANLFFPNDWDIVKAKFDYKSAMEGFAVFREAIQCDTFINVPIAKHHSLTNLTLSMKNLMGVCSGNRETIHFDIGRKLVDLTGFINPELTVIDAYRVLLRNGPGGGKLEDVEKKNTVIVSEDPTLADIFAAKLMDKEPLSVPYIKNAIERNFGNSDLEHAKIFRVNA